MKGFELVYVVEDDLITATVTELIIRKNVYFGEVQRYPNGQLAFDALLRESAFGAEVPDLILLDLNMPVMDGWEFLDAFSALVLRKHVRVCVLTSSIHPEDIEKSKSYRQVEGYFPKPLDDGMLNQMVQLLG
ncbi:MAG: response regulator [Janthinobacterium lividum]